MTVAICLRCGRTKVGAFAYCPGCGFTPSTDADLAKSLLLSDRHLDPQSLEAIGAKIKGGEELNFDQESVDELAEVIKASGVKMPLGCRVIVWVPMIVLLLLIGWMIYIWAYM